MAGARTVHFTPLEDRPADFARVKPEPEPKRIVLHEEPEDSVLLLGAMLRDAKLVHTTLKALPFAGPDGYRGSLRVVAGAAERLKRRCAKMLGEQGESDGNA